MARNHYVAFIVIVIWEALFALPFTHGQSLKVLHPFTFTDDPGGVLARDSAGNLYGTVARGGINGSGPACCGAVWKAAPNGKGGWTVSLIHEFNGVDGDFPNSGIVIDSSGDLYGTAFYGGIDTVNGRVYGTVFELLPDTKGGWNFQVLHEFDGLDGFEPYGKLTLDSAGNLYGTTTSGGTSTACNAGCGVVFKLAKNSDGTWTESVLHSFNGSDGSQLWAGVLFDSSGNLYSTTALGGLNQYGTVFKMTPGSGGTWTESVLYNFTNGADGAYPYSDLTFDTAGNLYGTTYDGGIPDRNGSGVVFELTPNADGTTWTETPIHTFAVTRRGADGSNPSAGVTFDSAGNLYGTTFQGGGKGVGVIYKLTPSGGAWSETILHDFWGYGINPTGTMLIDPSGHLFGTTSSGAHSYGMLFEFIP